MKNSFVLVTLVDITATGVLRGNTKERDQQRNWETVLQVLGLKTQPIILEGPDVIKSVNFQNNKILKEYFGEFYHESVNPQTLWAMGFTSDKENVYTINDLYYDFEQVPVILGLDETAKFMLPIFHSFGTLKNIHIFNASELNIN